MDELDLMGDAGSSARSFACSVNNWLMSMPVPMTP